MKMFEFKIVHGNQRETEDGVNELIDQGWQLYGTIQTSHYNGATLFTQTMVRPKEQRGPWN